MCVQLNRLWCEGGEAACGEVWQDIIESGCGNWRNLSWVENYEKPFVQKVCTQHLIFNVMFSFESKGFPHYIVKIFLCRYDGKFVDVSWEDVHSSLSGNGLHNILHLMDLLHSLPPTSVLNETAFNQMKLLKTDRRQRLSNNHLNDCLMIKLQSPAISEFDPKEAVDKWMVII